MAYLGKRLTMLQATEALYIAKGQALDDAAPLDLNKLAEWIYFNKSSFRKKNYFNP